MLRQASRLTGGKAIAGVGIVAASLLAGAPAASAGACDGDYYYQNDVNTYPTQVIGSTTPARNNTSGTLKDTYTVSASTTITGTVSASGTVSGDVGVAQASATVGTSFSLSVQAGFSRSLTFDIPPGQQGWVTLDRVPTDVLVTKYVYTPSCQKVVDGTALVKGSQTFVTAHTSPV